MPSSIRNYDSGSKKRKLKKEKAQQLKKYAGAMDKFILSTNEVSSSDDYLPNGNETSEIKDTDITSMIPQTLFGGKNSANFVPEQEIFNVSGNQEEFQVFYDEDPAMWLKIDECMIDFFISKPPNQNMDKLSETERQIGKVKRKLTKDHFYRIKQNSEKVLRNWLILSQSTKKLFCWVCKLFTTDSQKFNQLITGFDDWKHASVRLNEHENSAQHRQAVCQMSLRMTSSQRIDSALVKQNEEECNYWKSVLKRVVSVIKFLSLRGLPFFGENESIGSTNNGNFLGVLEVIAQFDPFLASHLEKYGNPGSGNVSYLSSTCINEFITVMSDRVLKYIVNELLSAKYYSIIIDSTADITHLDQLCFVVRYVVRDQPVERFLKFIPIYSHKSDALAENVLRTLEELGIDILHCRGQSYDNAANMAGKYSGLQAKIKAVNPLAEFVPCSAHSLNLVGVNAVESCSAALQFFFLIQNIYNFFSISTHRWQKLNDQIKVDGGHFSLKNRCTTRWCADASAVKSLRKNYNSILLVLDLLSKCNEETASTRSEALTLHKKMKKFETVLHIVIWDTLLQRLYQTNIDLQKISTNLSQVVPLYQSLIDFTQTVRDNFNLYEKIAEELCGEKQNYEALRIKKVPRSKDPDAINAGEAQFTLREKYIAMCHYPICDSLISNLSDRQKKYKTLTSKFACLTNIKSSNMREVSVYLQKCYESDIADTFPDELLQFSSLIEVDDTISTMLNKAKNFEETFPNVETILRIFLSLPVSNCSGERSFSLLKRIKSSNRNTLLQEKLSSLALLCIESDVTQTLDFEDVINDFAKMKVRRKHII